MFKFTVLYGHPADPNAFEDYYAKTHMPIAARIKGASRVELTRFTSAPGGGRPAFYRMAEFVFASESQMAQTLSSPEAKAAVDDLPNFASGGVTVMIGTVEI